MPLDAAQIFAHLQSRVGDAVMDFTPPSDPAGKESIRDAFCKVVPERWHDVAAVLRDDEALRFDFLQCITGVDWPKANKIECVYHLYSYPLRHSFVVKAEMPRENPVVPSVTDLWATADWNEREQFDLVGIGFSNHPDLRRIMLPDDWVGHPLRKDWKEPARYRNMPTTRPSPLDLLPMYDKAHAAEHKSLPIVGQPATAAAPENNDPHKAGH